MTWPSSTFGASIQETRISRTNRLARRFSEVLLANCKQRALSTREPKRGGVDQAISQGNFLPDQCRAPPLVHATIKTSISVAALYRRTGPHTVPLGVDQTQPRVDLLGIGMAPLLLPYLDTSRKRPRRYLKHDARNRRNGC